MRRPTASATQKREEKLLGRCSFLLRAQVWPHPDALNPRQWLQNFAKGDEKLVAHDLLRSFMYFSPRMTRELLRTAVRKIIPYLVNFAQPPGAVLAAWQQAIRQLQIIPVRGEEPSTADSGFHYSRLLRNMFGLPDSQFPDVRPTLLNLLVPSTNQRIILFVDDFVGTGQQFTTLWTTEYRYGYDMAISFADVASSSGALFFYCPLVTTTYGLEHIRSVCGNQVVICPAHVISDEYNALHPNSRIWSSPDIKQMAPTVLANIANRVGMPDEDGDTVDDWRGYHKLGLGLAINDAMPDACLGVFRFKQHGWRPLFNKAA